MKHAGEIFGSYGVTLGAIGAYSWWMLRRGRRLAAQVRDEDRPWT